MLPPRRARLVLLLAAAVAAACGPGDGEAAARPPDLVLLTVDTLRADHLGAYGDAETATPALDRLAERSLVVDRAWTVVPITTPSLATMLTGLHPREHGALDNAYDLAVGVETLPRRLARERGYATAAFLPTPLADKPGFRAAFDVYDAPPAGGEVRRGEEVVARALAWLDEAESRDRPFFLWVHLVDPHAPYAAGPPYEARHLPPGTGSVPARLRREARGERVELAPEEAAVVRALYRAEVERTDDALAPLVDRLLARDDPLVLLFTADHGEMLHEHEDYVGHTAWLHEPTLRVPLLVYATDAAGGRLAGRPASNLDVAPTLAARAGLAWAGEGEDLLSPEGRAGAGPLLVHETYAPEGVRDKQAARWRGSLLRSDPARPWTRPGALVEGELVRERAGGPGADELARRYAAWAEARPAPGEHARPALSRERREELERLGYLQGEE